MTARDRNDSPLTMKALLAAAERRLGSRGIVMDMLRVSRNRLYSVEQENGAKLRPERLLQLGLVVGISPVEALYAGRQDRLARLLEEALKTYAPEATALERLILCRLHRLPESTQEAIAEFVVGLTGVVMSGEEVASTDSRDRSVVEPSVASQAL